jgi:nucleoside-diphosphate-sugar epimerase
MTMPIVLLTGATGAVGPTVVRELVNLGYSVRTLSLDKPQPNSFPSEVDIYSGDISDPKIIFESLQGVDAVVHMAALLHIVNPSPELREAYESVNVKGTANIVSSAVRAGVKRLVFFSTIAVYGYNNRAIISEDTIPQPDTFYAQTKLAAEKIVLTSTQMDSRHIGCVLRFGAIYGPRIKGNYRRLLLSLAKNRFVPIGNGENRRSLIYDRDVARAVVLALKHPKAAGKIFNVTDGNFHSINEIIRVMCKALGKHPPRFSIPLKPVRFAASLMEDSAKRIGKQSPITRVTVDKYVEDVAVDSQRIQNELGFKPLFDLESGWEDTVRAMRQMGDL